MQKIIAFFMTILMFFFPRLNLPKADVDKESWTTDYTCVFVHGLSGWGAYSPANYVMPYWGMLGGDLMKYLNARGFKTAAATVAPADSAWDRACELYAQLTGTKVDYGKEHSERCHHPRFGKDFSCFPLIESFSAEDKINLLGHSFGGATVLTFLELMANGSEAEKAVTPEDELSGLFTGGKGDWVYSVTALSAPMNGTSAYEVMPTLEEHADARVYLTTDTLNLASTTTQDGRIADDSATYDMHIDNAMKMLEGIETLSHVYYFSLPCCYTEQQADGTWAPKKDMEPLFVSASERMGKYTGVTEGGCVVDEKWQQNDGLVNTYSARAPFNAPQQDLDRDDIRPGIWNVMPTFDGDHMALQGGLVYNDNIRELYVDLLTMINTLS
ncbi:MAG: hypothetical protein IJK89_08330 [Clostridia bacterium]|nr:hypothetical protein [Clostridia bacterium]